MIRGGVWSAKARLFQPVFPPVSVWYIPSYSGGASVATCSRLTGKGADEAVALYGAKQHLVYDARIVLPACTPAV